MTRDGSGLLQPLERCYYPTFSSKEKSEQLTQVDVCFIWPQRLLHKDCSPRILELGWVGHQTARVANGATKPAGSEWHSEALGLGRNTPLWNRFKYSLERRNAHENFAYVLIGKWGLASGAHMLKMEQGRRLAWPLSSDNMQISIKHSKFLRKLLLNANFRLIKCTQK